MRAFIFAASVLASVPVFAQKTVNLSNPYTPAVSGLLSAAVNTTRVDNPDALPVTQTPVGVSASGGKVYSAPVLGLSLPVGTGGGSLNVNVPMPAVTLSRPANPAPSVKDAGYSPVPPVPAAGSPAAATLPKLSTLANWPVIQK